jgi:2-polyprenyl-3-methyl-5-hydroxy-6-metoxy-1,4-benzoquinol methylase
MDHAAQGGNEELEKHFAHVRSLEAAYLQHDDPIRQSGFGGGAERWRSERSAILDAAESPGDILDIGCANGYLLECLCSWAAERGLQLRPHGLDIGAELIELARRRLPQYSANFHCGNAWDWNPPRRYRYVYALHDCVPAARLAQWTSRLLSSFVEPGGRLIIGAYGSNSRQQAALDIASLLSGEGFRIAGESSRGELPVVRVVWLDAPG